MTVIIPSLFTSDKLTNFHWSFPVFPKSLNQVPWNFPFPFKDGRWKLGHVEGPLEPPVTAGSMPSAPFTNQLQTRPFRVVPRLKEDTSQSPSKSCLSLLSQYLEQSSVGFKILEDLAKLLLCHHQEGPKAPRQQTAMAFLFPISAGISKKIGSSGILPMEIPQGGWDN